MPVLPQSVYSEERVTKIVEAIKCGNTRLAAAKCAGVSLRALQAWLARGRAGEEPFTRLADGIREAEGVAEEAMVNVVRNAAEAGAWQAAAWWLERFHYKTWGRRDTVRLAPLPDPDKLSPAQLEAAIQGALEARARLAH